MESDANLETDQLRRPVCSVDIHFPVPPSAPDLIRKYAKEEVKNSPHIDTEECAYLLDVAERRAFQLEHNLPPTDKLK